MALFGGSKTYDSIVAPLNKMVTDLKTYIEEQRKKIQGLEDQKLQIESDINTSNSEIAKSSRTAVRIDALMNGGDDSADVSEDTPTPTE